MILAVSQSMCFLAHRVWMGALFLCHLVHQLCRKVRFLGQNPNIGPQGCHDLQTPTLSKTLLCDRTLFYAVGSLLLVAVLIIDGRFALRQIHTYLLITKAEAAVADEEFIGPFPSWTNVKTMYGAVGDGVTDDSAALQRALNDLGRSSTSTVLYLPAGTYRITRQLVLDSRLNIGVIGEDPALTVIKWDGPANGVMIYINGVAYSRFNRITWDGSGRALVAVDQSWDGATPHFDTGNEYMDDMFKDVKYGIRGGDLGYGFAETTVIRSKFIRNSQAGIILRNFNALDLYVWYATFEDCNKGITNNPGAGNYRVYNSLFRNSTVTDLEIVNTGGFSARNNTSIGSNAFLTAGGTSNAAELNVQGNTIIDPKSTTAIAIGNQGPLLLLDNVFRSKAGQTQGPVVYHASFVNQDTIAIGNTFTVNNPIQVGSSGRLITIDNTTVARDSLNVGEPNMPATPLNLHRRVFEIPPGASAAVIQQTINSASVTTATRPVVHLPGGTYAISTTLSISAESDLQLVGDDYGTSVLQWTGAGNGPVLHIKGPSKVRVRDLMVQGNNIADGIVADTIDQPGARIFLGQTELRYGARTHLWVDGLDYAKVDVRNFGSAYMNSGVSVKVVGGLQAANGVPAGGRTDIFSGASALNPMSYEVTNGGQLLVRDMWYETPSNFPAFVNLASTTGTFTLDGSRIALPANQSPPAIVVNGFRGKATFLTSNLDDRIVISGDGGQTNVLGLGMVGKLSPYFINTSSPAARAALFNSRQAVTNVPGTGSIPVANQRTIDPVFIKDMIAQTRTARPGLLTDLPPGVSDIRFYRIGVTNAVNAIHLLPGVSSTPFDFSLANSGNISVIRGMQGTRTITASLSSGTRQSVAFSASGLPTGTTAAFSRSSCTPTCTTTMTVQTAASTLTGSYSITVTGTAGTLSRTTSFTLKVRRR